MLKRTILLGLLLALAGAAGAVKEVKIIIHTDHLGSPIMGRSMDGETLWERHYEPYGSQDQAPDDPASPGYTGHLEERDSGLVYAGARWYDPRVGRFLSPDPIDYIESNPVSFNRYSYANNTPYNFSDPDGKQAFRAIRVLLGSLKDKIRGKRSNKTVQDLVDGSLPGRKTRGRAHLRHREGGYKQAKKDFHELGVREVKPIEKGYRGVIRKDGKDVNVNVRSSSGQDGKGPPTLEMQIGKNRVLKFRYDK